MTKIIHMVEHVKRPLFKGENYLVPCIIRQENEILYITPVINHPHNDKENGQKEIHYHVDYRFVKHEQNGQFPSVINKHSKYFFVENIRPKKEPDGKLEYFILPVINESFSGITSVIGIKKSKFKHKCIYKGKCPHRGYDLSQTSAENGIITCPLHGLIFDESSKKILNR